MVYRLRNEKASNNCVHLTGETWYSILDLAEEFGWNPMGAVIPGEFQEYGLSSAGTHLGVALNLYWNGGSEGGRLVVFEDALNMADALERAFMEYEPVRVPASYFFFEPLDQTSPTRPALGALAAVIDICRTGAFWIELEKRMS